MRLAVRFDPEVGQSILSYALDLSRANGYPNLSVLISGLQLPKSFATRPCDLSPLARASGLTISSSRLEDLCFWPLQNQSGYIQFLGQRMSAASVDLARPKVCMRRLEEGKQIPAVWNLRCYLACPDHGNLLTYAACSACGRDLSWFRRSRLICGCGAALAAQEVPASDTLLTLSSALRALFDGAPLGSTIAPVSTLDAAARLVWFGGTHRQDERRWRSRFLSKPGPADSLSVAERGAPLLIRWPNGLFAWLREHRRAGQTALSSAFGPILERIKNSFRDDEAFDLVIEEIRRFLVHSDDAPLIKRHSFFYTNGERLSQIISGSDAARMLWVSSASIVKLVHNGILEGESRAAGKRHAIFVDRTSVAKILDQREETLTTEGAAQILGVSPYQVNRLRRSEVLFTAIDTKRLQRRGLRISIDAVLHISSRLAECSHIACFEREHVRLTDIPQLHNINLGDVIARILEKEVEIFLDDAINASAPILARFFVKRTAIFGFRYLESQRFISIDVASKRLHVAKRMIPILVRAGCLETAGDNRGDKLQKRSITETSVAQFPKHFAMTSVLAQKLSTNTRSVLKQLRENGIAPTIDSDSKRGISAVWRLSDQEVLSLSKTLVVDRAKDLKASQKLRDPTF
jgi:hypothetical protein